MSVSYLIAHKVRGEPAFDVAKRMRCSLCARGQRDSDGVMTDCDECNGEGYWWIIPTSGHRARPYWTIELGIHALPAGFKGQSEMEIAVPPMPQSLPDHYLATTTPEPVKPSGLLKLLGLGRAAVQIKRRV